MATEVMTAPEGRIIHKTYAVLSGAAMPQRVHVTQYDESLPVIACTLYKDGQLYTIPDGASVRMRMNKNGLPVYHEAMGIDDPRHVVYLEITAQMTVLYGEFAMVLEVETSDGKTAGTSYLRLIVRQNPVQNPDLDNIPDYTANSNRLTAEGVKKLQSESSTQQKAIEDKGKNTLESIPADYSTMSGKVDENANGISELKKDIGILDKILDGNYKPLGEEIKLNLTNATGYWSDDNHFYPYEGITSESFSVNGKDRFILSSYSYYGVARAVFFDFNNNVVGRYWNGNYVKYEENSLIIVPENATSMVIQNHGNREIHLSRVTHYELIAPNEKVDALSERIDNTIVLTHGKNLYNEKEAVVGYINDKGGINASDVWETTGFINVEDINSIYCTGKVDGTRQSIYTGYWTSYDENKNFISQFLNEAYRNYPVSIPSNAKYLRLCYKPASSKEIQIESGTIPTDYEKYWEGYIFASSPYNNKLKNTNWIGKKWVCVGDSLTENNIRTTKHYHDYIADETGISVINMGSSGTGYKKTEEEGKAFYQRILNVPADADVVTIFGSFNDVSLVGTSLGTPTDSGTETICGCINTTIDRLFQKIPRIQLGIISPTPWMEISETNSFGKYVESLSSICKNRGIPYLDLYHCSGLRPWTTEGKENFYSKDDGHGTHPDEYGHKFIAPRFKAFLDGLIM